MTKGIFITGTDTDVGKTIVTAGILYLLRKKGYKATYFKAALSGAIEEEGELIPGDTRLVETVSGLQEPYENTTPYIYKTAVSPHLAAQLEQLPIEKKKIQACYTKLKEKYEIIIAEGSGGIVCPLIQEKEETYLLENLIQDLNMNVIVVTRAGLGTINHTVLTVKYIERLGIKVKGIIINGFEDTVLCRDNVKLIKELTKVPILGIVPFIENLQYKTFDMKNLQTVAETSIDIDKIVQCLEEL